MSATLELIAVWVAIAAYSAATVGFTLSTFLRRDTLERVAVYATAAGACAQAVSIVLRWVRIGHGPYIGFFEVSTLLALVCVTGFLLLTRRFPAFSAAGFALLPVALLLVGGSLLVDRQAQQMTGSLASLWLVVHVVFANLAFGLYAASFVLGVGFLLQEGSAAPRLVDRLPAPEVVEGLTYRMVGAGFVFQTVMIASGAIWANEAWGRYWGWDPVETWSLVAWGVYAVYLHLTLTLGWRGRKAAWVAVLALPVILFSLLGVPLVYHSIHGAYLAL